MCFFTDTQSVALDSGRDLHDGICLSFSLVLEASHKRRGRAWLHEGLKGSDVKKNELKRNMPSLVRDKGLLICLPDKPMVFLAEHCVDSVAIPSGETARERRGPV